MFTYPKSSTLFTDPYDLFNYPKIVYCLLTLMTTPAHLHLVFTSSRPHYSTSKRYDCKS